MNGKHNYKRSIVIALFAISLFLFLYLFFSVEHPLYVYDSDDWTYISYSRHIWPSVKNWNPTRILPEILMPLAAQFGVSVLMPFTGDYLGSMAYAFAAVLSIFIVFYILFFGKVVCNRFSLSEKESICLMVIIFLLSFLPFIKGSEKNEYLFYSGSVTNIFFYTIPALLNSALVLYMLSSDNHSLLKDTHYLKTGGLILAIYLCINSNMFQNIIISSYAAAHIIYEAILRFGERKFHKNTVLSFLYDNFDQLIILCLWFISLYFESQGGRASQLGSSTDFNLQYALQSFVSSLNRLDHFYLFQLCCIVGAAVIAFGRYKKLQGQQANLRLEKNLIRLSGISIIACIGTILYLVLLEAVTGAGYISRTDCMISWMFWLFVIEVAALAYLIRITPPLKRAIPLFILCLIFETFMYGNRYKDISSYGEPEIIKQIDDYIVQQVVIAERSGQNYVEVHIPLHNSFNWPLNTDWGGERMALSLYRHGITDTIMDIVLIPDESINKRFHF